MLKKLFALCTILFTLVSLQSQQRSIYFESHVLPTDSIYANCFLSFKIAYNRLVFIKNNGSYTAGAEIHYELFEGDEVKKHLTSSNSVEITNYEETKSSDLFLEGLVQFSLKPGEYRVVPSVILDNTKDEVLLKNYTVELNVDSSSQSVFSAVVYSDLSSCSGVSGKRLVNMENIIPFDESKYDLLITVINSDIKNILVEIKQDEKTISAKELNNYLSGNVILSECKNGIVCTNDKSIGDMRTYLLKDVNEGLLEGPVTINILSASDTLLSKSFEVVWYNRPQILDNVELATLLYEKVTNDNKIDSIYDAPSEEYYKNLFGYWRRFDPVKSTTFNELMYEFYDRADSAQDKFKTADNLSGAKTDRGIIFIKYGQPDSITRNYNKKNKIIEIWKYEKLGKEFIFEDSSGLGNYQLVE